MTSADGLRLWRQRSEQYFTSSQTLAHALRQTIGRPQAVQVDLDQAIDRIAEIRIHTEREEAGATGLAEFGVLLVQHGQRRPQRIQVGLQHPERGGCVEFAKRRWCCTVDERLPGFGMQFACTKEAVVVRHDLLPCIRRQRGTDRHRPEQVAHVRMRAQVGADAQPEVVQAAGALVGRRHEAAAQFDALHQPRQQVAGIGEQRRAVQARQPTFGEDAFAGGDAVAAGDFQRLAVPEHDVVVPGVVGVQVQALAGALARGAEGDFAQAADLAQQR